MSSDRRRFDEDLRLAHRAGWLVGVDEAGRGPLAGPVVVAAVCLGHSVPRGLSKVRDSKKMPARERRAAFAILRRKALIAVAWATPRQIERDNILAATLSAMRRAAARLLARLPKGRGLVVVDGNRRIPDFETGADQLAVPGGDDLSLAVACASVVAKTVRDAWMGRVGRRFPAYGFQRHKGYATSQHLEALKRLGPASVHRKTYAPVAQALLPFEDSPDEPVLVG